MKLPVVSGAEAVKALRKLGYNLDGPDGAAAGAGRTTAAAAAGDRSVRSNCMAYDLGLADRIRVALGRLGEYSEKKMFGGLCFMVNGNMCCGIVKNDLMLRLTDQIAAESLRELHTRPMDFSGKPMKSMIYVAAEGLDSDSALERWVTTAARVGSLPAKRKRP